MFIPDPEGFVISFLFYHFFCRVFRFLSLSFSYCFVFIVYIVVCTDKTVICDKFLLVGLYVRSVSHVHFIL